MIKYLIYLLFAIMGIIFGACFLHEEWITPPKWPANNNDAEMM